MFLLSVTDVSCLQEMAVMFACMKANDFREAKCTPEIDSFTKCYTEYMVIKNILNDAWCLPNETVNIHNNNNNLCDYLFSIQQNKKLTKQREESGEMVIGTNPRSLTTKQLNKLLQKFPQYNEKL